jgi:hypothetical protein
VFVVFSGNPFSSAIATNVTYIRDIDENVDRAEATVSGNGKFFIQTPKGLFKASVEGLPGPMLLTGPWDLVREKEPARRLVSLGSWTEFPEFENFSGTISYRCQLDVPGSYTGKGIRLDLDLGEVRDIAEVILNGEVVGVLWKRPFLIDVSRLTKPGRNTLEVRVTNRLINRMLLSAPLPPPYVDLKSRVSQPVTSGLMGPVWLHPSMNIILTR